MTTAARRSRRLPNVETYLDSRLDAAQVLEFGFRHTCIATGSEWRADGRGRFRFDAIPGCPNGHVVTPDAIMGGARVGGPVVVYDDDHFYMGGLIAEMLRLQGLDVLLVTSASCLSPETERTLEQGRIQTRALELGVELLVSHEVTGFDGDEVTVACAYSGRESVRILPDAGAGDLPRAQRLALRWSSAQTKDGFATPASSRVSRIGDCAAPGPIAQAVFAGHRYAQELGANDVEADRDRVVLRSVR